MKARRGIGSFFGVAGLGFLVLAGVLVFAVGGAGASIAALTFALIGGIWVLVAVGLTGFYGRMAKSAAAEQRLFETGRRATAVVDGVETTGMVMNEVNQQIILSLRIQPPGEAEWVHQRKMFVPFHGIPRTGDLIQVGYDPADRTKVALEIDPRSDTAGGRLLVLRRPSDAPVPAAAADGGGQTAPERMIEQLERLNRLKEDGALTEAEFELQKAKVLAGGGL